MSEYGHYIALLVAVGQQQHVEQLLQQQLKGTKACHRLVFPGGVLRDDMVNKYGEVAQAASWVEGQPCEVLHVGIPREPEYFIREAVSKGHPRDVITNVPDEVKCVVHSILDEDVAERFSLRAAFMKKCLRRSLELRE